MEDRMYEIIAAVLAGEEIRESDRVALHFWLQESAEHQRIFEIFSCFYRKGENYRRLGGVDRLSAYRRICEKGNIRPQLRKERWMWRISGIAAGFVLVVGMALTLVWNSPKISAPVECAGYFSPGSAKVRLKLQNGREVDLSSEERTVIVSETGLTAIRDSNLLDYQKIGPVSGNDGGEYNTLVVPVGAEYHLLLNDGTRVYMNSASELRYPTVFSRDRREVFLKGEAYFEVTRDTSRQFVVQAGAVSIEVLGTSFNVSAYADAKVISATLTSGKIRAVSGGMAYPVVPGEQFRKYILTGEICVEKVNTEMYTCWKDGYYYFDACPLSDIMQSLSRWYDIQVFFIDQSLKDIEFTGRLRRYEEVDGLFRKFEQTRNICFIRKGNTVMVKPE